MRVFLLVPTMLIIVAIPIAAYELPQALAQDIPATPERKKTASPPVKFRTQTNTSARTDKLYSLEFVKLPSWISNVPDDDKIPLSPTMRALPKNDPAAKSRTSECPIPLALASTRFVGTNDDNTSYSIPLKVAADGCISLLSADDKAFHVKIEAKGAINDFQSTLDYFARAKCEDGTVEKPSTASAQGRVKVPYAYSLSNVKVSTNPKPNGLNYAMTLTGELAGTPCDALDEFGLRLDFTHTRFISNVEVPLHFDAATLSIRPGSATATFVKSEAFGSQKSIAERAWIWTDAQHFETFQKKITTMIQGALTARLDVTRTENSGLAKYLDVGRFIPRDKFTNIQVTTTKLSTDNEALRFEVSLTGDVPRSYLDSSMNALLASYINDRFGDLGLR